MWPKWVKHQELTCCRADEWIECRCAKSPNQAAESEELHTHWRRGRRHEGRENTGNTRTQPWHVSHFRFYLITVMRSKTQTHIRSSVLRREQCKFYSLMFLQQAILGGNGMHSLRQRGCWLNTFILYLAEVCVGGRIHGWPVASKCPTVLCSDKPMVAVGDL